MIYGNGAQGRIAETKPTDLARPAGEGTAIDTTNEYRVRVLSEKYYELKDHLGNVRVVVTDMKEPTAQSGTYPFVAVVSSYANYYAYGMLQPGRHYEGGEWRYGFNGQERQVSLTSGGVLTAPFWAFDPSSTRRWELDPKPDFERSPYSTFASNPIANFDRLGDTITVTSDDGKYLLTLDDAKKESRTMTAKRAYDLGYQWFAPTADNYFPLLATAPGLPEMPELKHFSWSEIAAFSEVDRFKLMYAQHMCGDWKRVEAAGYLLVTVDGAPYWADAIGQIPFAVNMYRDLLRSNGSVDKSIRMTMTAARRFGNGNVFDPVADNSNSYDNAVALRAAIWASNRFVVKASVRIWGLGKPSLYVVRGVPFSPDHLGEPVSTRERAKYDPVPQD